MHHNMGAELPPEIWLYIFHLALDDESVFNYSLPNSMSCSSWFKLVYVLRNWGLRTPQETLMVNQRKTYLTAKAIVSTCKAWKRLGSEHLFRCLFIYDPAHLLRLCVILDRDSTLGWWTKRLHIARYYAGGGVTMEETQDALVSIIRQCPNLEIFIISWPMSNTFAPVADALSTYSRKSLRTLSLNVPIQLIAKVIWTLDSLPSLVSVHIELDGHPPDTIHLGAASGLCIVMPNLRQFSLRGSFQDLLEQITGWEIPKLTELSLDYINYREDFPDIIEFLSLHGKNLIYLDLDCIPALDVAAILDLCPLLTTFAFNADWRLPSSTGEPYGPCAIVHHPHSNITTIGCHQLSHAFGVGYAATYAAIDPVSTYYIRRTNDTNFAALNKSNFPKLKCIRILSRVLLRDLEAANGPDEVCFERWERWWMQCARQGIRLEDCTGQSLGTLPDSDCGAKVQENTHGGEKKIFTESQALTDVDRSSREQFVSIPGRAESSQSI